MGLELVNINLYRNTGILLSHSTHAIKDQLTVPLLAQNSQMLKYIARRAGELSV